MKLDKPILPNRANPTALRSSLPRSAPLSPLPVDTNAPTQSALVRTETPIAFVRAIVHTYTLRGIDPAGALRSAHIAPELLRQSGACITALQMERVSDAAMRELDDEALGWFSARLPWGSYGMLARASITAPHLGLAMERWCRHHGLLTQDVRLELAHGDDGASLTLHESRDMGPLREFCHVSLLRNALGVASWLVDSRIPLQAANFAYDAPPHASAYAVLFGGAVRFGAAHTSIAFDTRYLALPLRRDETALQAMLRHALPLQVLHYRKDRLLVARVRQLLVVAPPAEHTAADLAARLNLSLRTLHRQLKDEGASLQALKDGVRRDIATDLLQRSRRPIKQVALAAGFQNEKSFIRAFKGWTGLTPGEWRGRA